MSISLRSHATIALSLIGSLAIHAGCTETPSYDGDTEQGPGGYECCVQGMCMAVPEPDGCDELNGTLIDPGNSCSAVCSMDPPPPAGTCCAADGSCFEASGAAGCGGGEFREGVLCEEPCPVLPAPGACCDNGSCSFATAASCERDGGQHHPGEGCQEACLDFDTGACCTNDSCEDDIGALDCGLRVEGTFFNSMSCEEACPSVVPVGACCLMSKCTDNTTEAACIDRKQGGEGLDWQQDATCEDTCPTGTGLNLSAGVYPTLSAPEGPTIIRPGWAMTARDQYPVGFSGSDATWVVDLKTNALIYEETVSGFGMLAFGTPTDYKSTYGATGTTLQEWSDADSDWAFSSFGTNAATDAQLTGDSMQAANVDAWIETQFPSGNIIVNRFAIDGSLSDSTFVDPVAIAAASPNTVISAYALHREGPVVAVTDGVPSQMVLHDLSNPTAAATLVGDVGDDARRIRCLPPVCVTSHFGGGTLRAATWDGSATPPVLADEVVVGDGPVGIDLRADGDEVVVVSTGFNDNTYSVTRFAADGTSNGTVSNPVPDGCEGPAHAVWAQDDTGPKIVVSCTTSAAYAVIDPS